MKEARDLSQNHLDGCCSSSAAVHGHIHTWLVRIVWRLVLLNSVYLSFFVYVFLDRLEWRSNLSKGSLEGEGRRGG